MRRLSRWVGVAMAAGWGMLAPSVWAEATLNVTANRSQLYLGESVLLSVEVRGTQEIEAPDLTRIAGTTIAARGSRMQNMSSIVMSSGGSPIVRREIGRDFIFELTPTNVGNFVAGPISVRAGGEMLTAPGPALYVMGVEAQDWVKLSVTASRDAVLVDESFEIELSVALRQLQVPYEGHDPLNPQDPPRLQAPFLNAAPIDGLQGPDIQAMLQRQLVSRNDQPGFGINDYTVRADPFDSIFNMGGFAEQRAARFQLPRRTVSLTNGTYHVYAIRLTYVAKVEGDYTFGPVELKGQPIIDVAPGGQIVTRPVFAVGPAAVVRVVPPPEEGRPPSFVGAIGTNLVVSARLDTQTCNVGDPLTLTLDIGGDISLDNLRPPVLGDQPALRERFRIYDDTVQVRSRPGGKLYSYTVRPTQAGTYELPPIAISYYDVQNRAYHTAYTAPIPLRANEAAQVGGSMIISSSTNRTSQRMTFSAMPQEAQVAPMTMDPAGATTRPLLAWSRHGVIAGAGPLVLLVAALAKGVRHRWSRRAGSARPRGARRAALAVLDQAAGETDRRRREAGVRTALAVYVSDRFNAPTTGLAPSDVRRLLQGQEGLPPDLVTRYADFYDRLFQAEFAPLATVAGAGEAAELAQLARALILELDNAMSAAKGTRHAPRAQALSVGALLFLTLSQAQASEETQYRFMWDQANAHLSSAQTPPEFAQAAELYRQLILQGARNAPLFYNYGIALLEAGRVEDAARAFQRAERIAGNDADVRQNLEAALSRNPASGNLLLPWYRVFLFWHFGLDFSTRAAAALSGFSLLCLALALRLWGRPGAAAQLHAVAVVLMVVFGSSVGASLHAESRDQNRERALGAIHAESSP